MNDPFSSAFRVAFVSVPVASLKITGYLVVFLIQVPFYIVSGRPDKIVDAWGYLGRAVTDALAKLLSDMF